jgi:hypothetical protein
MLALIHAIQDTYVVQRYGQVNSTAGKIQRKYVKKAVPEGDLTLIYLKQMVVTDFRSTDDHPHFLEYATELANALRHTIFVDQV